MLFIALLASLRTSESVLLSILLSFGTALFAAEPILPNTVQEAAGHWLYKAADLAVSQRTCKARGF